MRSTKNKKKIKRKQKRITLVQFFQKIIFLSLVVIQFSFFFFKHQQR